MRGLSCPSLTRNYCRLSAAVQHSSHSVSNCCGIHTRRPSPQHGTLHTKSNARAVPGRTQNHCHRDEVRAQPPSLAGVRCQVLIKQFFRAFQASPGDSALSTEVGLAHNAAAETLFRGASPGQLRVRSTTSSTEVYVPVKQVPGI